MQYRTMHRILETFNSACVYNRLLGGDNVFMPCAICPLCLGILRIYLPRSLEKPRQRAGCKEDGLLQLSR